MLVANHITSKLSSTLPHLFLRLVALWLDDIPEFSTDIEYRYAKRVRYTLSGQGFRLLVHEYIAEG